ncbi:hypothetical protein NQ318_013093 [Aromia moschata]|uniref:Beta-hexosaminidase n=1 Tax=Aromia moschata TaxID=1265417 RepID=A0AAV8Y1I0_9CUCU|nr:hypothetical protein NQ318_013093 [Aromia moschata]
MIAVKLLITSALLLSVDCYIVDPGPKVIATKGEVWPKPQLQQNYDSYFIVQPQIFEFRIIWDGYQKGRDNFDSSSNIYYKKLWLSDDNYLGYLSTLNVSLHGPCVEDEYPSFSMSEEYTLVVTDRTVELSSNTTWGILRGLETFSQLIYRGDDTITLRINSTVIMDYPRFSHRGLLLDTARHYIPMDKILTTLDAMVYNKMNVFHWHIVDDQSFPYVSKKFPELSEKGAYTNAMVYSPSDIKEVIEYARIRGIRVLPEFDTPGHTRSWGVARPELLTECYSDGYKTGQLGPLDPTKNDSYSFLQDLFQEIGEVFPDEYIHLGGDEVDFDCWESNPDITAFMEKHNITGQYAELESLYIQQLINIVDELNSKSIVWEEVFVNGVVLPNDTLVHVWKGGWEVTIFDVTATGRPALLSACWYLDHLDSDGDWEKFYSCDPYGFFGTDEQKKLVLGGEACMWSEVVNEYNVISRVWPRASAAAEKLWSSENVTDVTDAAKRLEEHTCRMNARGIGAQPPNAAGYCL